MRRLLGFLVVFSMLVVGSCRKDFSTAPSSGNLFFSKDTVYLDTIFTNIGSATYNLKVYNKSNEDITVPSIRLENGQSSNYRLNVDGIPGKAFENIDILAKDSIFIFVETTVDISTVSDPLYTDRILFDQGANEQDVDLVTLVQDAHFIYPGRDPISMNIDVLTLDGESTEIQGRFLEDSELNFTAVKPYVIYGYAAVGDAKTLTIDAGARIHFHANSGLIVDNGGRIVVNGTLEDQVVFEGDRLESAFDNVPGQWGTIWLRENSVANQFNYAVIKNGIIGLLTDGRNNFLTRNVTISNSEIYNHSSFGILARESKISSSNSVYGSAGQSSVALTEGGNYEFTHCTFANFWNNSLRSLPAVLVNNFSSSVDANGQEVFTPKDLLGASFTNSLIDGNQNIEFIADRIDGGNFEFMVSHTLLQFNDPNGTYDGVPELDFTNSSFYSNITLNGNSDFRNPFMNDFIIGENSDAIGLGNSAAAALFPMDILGVGRVGSPDLGAYQHITF